MLSERCIVKDGSAGLGTHAKETVSTMLLIGVHTLGSDKIYRARADPDPEMH